MQAFGSVSYGVAACGFVLLAVLLLFGSNQSRHGGHLVAASVLTGLSAAVLALQPTSFVVIYFSEMIRNVAWLLVLAKIARGAAPSVLINITRLACIVLPLVPLIAPMLASFGVPLGRGTVVLSRVGLVSALLGLVLLEQIYRSSGEASRSALRYFVMGVGILFAYDLFLYSQSELMKGISAEAWQARGLVNALAVPLIAIAARRHPQWAPKLFVSRQVVFYTTSFVAIGAYLLFMSAGGYFVREIGGSWGTWLQLAFFAGAAVVLATVIASSVLRRRVQVFIAKHFYRNKYDYRIEWLRFVQTLSCGEDDVKRTSVRAVAQIFESPGGILFTVDEQRRWLTPAAAWPINEYAVKGLARVGVSSELVKLLQDKQWIVDLKEYREGKTEIYDHAQLPAWLLDESRFRLVSPILKHDELVGFLLLYDPEGTFELTYEDRDLLKTVGRHMATHIAQFDADRKLAESRQFEAYNRFTAFMMHDLKNSVAQLQLIVKNAAKHRGNPEFFDDAMSTISNAVDRMTSLIEQLRGSENRVRLQRVSVQEVVGKAVARCSDRAPLPQVVSDMAPSYVRADPERLTSVIEHVLRNAQDAASDGGSVAVSVTQPAANEVMLDVVDTGIGMDEAFVRDRLFRPFDSTKGSKGMGIGAYQVREYVQMLGGHVEVQSTPGSGTSFSIMLPLAPPESPGKPVHGNEGLGLSIPRTIDEARLV